MVLVPGLGLVLVGWSVGWSVCLLACLQLCFLICLFCWLVCFVCFGWLLYGCLFVVVYVVLLLWWWLCCWWWWWWLGWWWWWWFVVFVSLKHCCRVMLRRTHAPCASLGSPAPPEGSRIAQSAVAPLTPGSHCKRFSCNVLSGIGVSTQWWGTFAADISTKRQSQNACLFVSLFALSFPWLLVGVGGCSAFVWLIGLAFLFVRMFFCSCFVGLMLC